MTGHDRTRPDTTTRNLTAYELWQKVQFELKETFTDRTFRRYRAQAFVPQSRKYTLADAEAIVEYARCLHQSKNVKEAQDLYIQQLEQQSAEERDNQVKRTIDV